jgi:hypothetical protein
MSTFPLRNLAPHLAAQIDTWPPKKLHVEFWVGGEGAPAAEGDAGVVGESVLGCERGLKRRVGPSLGNTRL